MRHYFLNTPHEQQDYFKYEDYFEKQKFVFHSCSDVFSKNSIDYGTYALLKTVLNNYNLNNSYVLDLGCGVGVIGIVLMKHYPNIKVTFSDVNENACLLTQKNIKENKINNETEVVTGSLYENVKGKFSFVITNPPIKAGKDTLFGVVSGAKNILDENGRIVLVIKKQHGMESLKKYMENTFGNVEILQRDRGYYILTSKK